MRLLLILLIILTHYFCYAYGATDVEERRIEEEKRQQLKSTEAQFYEESKTTVKEDVISTRQFLGQLTSKDVVDHRDAAQTLAILLGKDDDLKSFEDQRQFFIEVELLSQRQAERFSESTPLRRGLFARMLLLALNIKGGLTLRVFGPYERYALSELVYEDIMISGSTREWMSGRELVYTFIQAANYIAKNNLSHE